jgi:endonuclease/exonuclease/phosphatase family metal-dependent hydrolase
MTTILTWNIQCGLGVDGRVDLVRIADVVRSMTDADVICLQEVSRFNPELDGGENVDQVAALAALFPEYRPVFGAAIDRLGDRTGERRQFGNMILSRHPVLQIFRHQLPQPAPESTCKHMPRQALETVVETNEAPLRITTTHLEFHSEVQRLAQAHELHRIHDDVVANRGYAVHAPPAGPYEAAARPADAVLCGDFNAAPDDPVYDTLLLPVRGEDSDRYRDAWRTAHGETPHAPTCGIHDTKQWPQGPHCRDFFFTTGAPTKRIREVRVNEETAASDHQPVVLVLDM